MRIGIMQPYLFPYIGYFQLIHAVDKYVIYDDVRFIKGGWINRNNFLINGEKKLLSIPLEGASPNKNINEILIKDNFSKIEKTLEMSYSRAPYVESTMEVVRKILSLKEENLAKFIANSLFEIADYLDIKTQFIYSSDLKKDSSLKGQGKVLAICKELGAKMYINAIGGQALYSKEKFAKNGLELKFLKPNLIVYEQLSNEFLPGLSIIDVMMFNSPEKIKVMLDDYELV